jgi:TIGR03009 family protein
LLALAAVLILHLPARGQQLLASQQGAAQSAPAAGQPAAGAQPASVQVPAGFQLNVLEQTRLDAVLAKWQAESAKVSTFRCPFERWEYNAAFGPAPNVPLFKNQGELSFEKPDKGSFQITKVLKWKETPAAPGQPPPRERTGDWVADPNAVGEHWVCDGKNVYEYRHDQKQLVVRPIPPQLQGKAIVDGPLPFLFGADAAKLKARYWLRLDEAYNQANPNQILIDALPRFQADAANYRQVQVILNQATLLPEAMQVHLPNHDRNVYMFDLQKAKVNGLWQQIKNLFAPPELLPGWQRVVEEMPVQQAAQPGQLRR